MKVEQEREGEGSSPASSQHRGCQCFLQAYISRPCVPLTLSHAAASFKAGETATFTLYGVDVGYVRAVNVRMVSGDTGRRAGRGARWLAKSCTRASNGVLGLLPCRGCRQCGQQGCSPNALPHPSTCYPVMANDSTACQKQSVGHNGYHDIPLSALPFHPQGPHHCNLPPLRNPTPPSGPTFQPPQEPTASDPEWCLDTISVTCNGSTSDFTYGSRLNKAKPSAEISQSQTLADFKVWGGVGRWATLVWWAMRVIVMREAHCGRGGKGRGLARSCGWMSVENASQAREVVKDQRCQVTQSIATLQPEAAWS